MQMKEFYMFHFVESLESLNVLTNFAWPAFFFFKEKVASNLPPTLAVTELVHIQPCTSCL